MWARVRRRVERQLEAMPFRHAGVVRPGYIQPGPGIRSKVKLYQAFIMLVKPVSGLLVRLLPSMATTSERCSSNAREPSSSAAIRKRAGAIR